jgi:peptidoglycan-associated lipoprotein
MRTRFVLVTTILLCWAGTALGQLIQVDPSELNGTSDAARNEKLASVPAVSPQEQQSFQQAVQDIHFDFDKATLRDEDRAILAKDAEWLKAHPDVMITLEGDADERGDIIYNVVLSGERAMAAKDALVEMGVPAERIAYATGWGKLYPVCAQSDESCWSQNRRTHFATWPPAEESSRQTAQAVAARGQ